VEVYVLSFSGGGLACLKSGATPGYCDESALKTAAPLIIKVALSPEWLRSLPLNSMKYPESGPMQLGRGLRLYAGTGPETPPPVVAVHRQSVGKEGMRNGFGGDEPAHLKSGYHARFSCHEQVERSALSVFDHSRALSCRLVLPCHIYGVCRCRAVVLLGEHKVLGYCVHDQGTNGVGSTLLFCR
jgi:hypothetical protein